MIIYTKNYNALVKMKLLFIFKRNNLNHVKKICVDFLSEKFFLSCSTVQHSLMCECDNKRMLEFENVEVKG